MASATFLEVIAVFPAYQPSLPLSHTPTTVSLLDIKITKNFSTQLGKNEGVGRISSFLGPVGMVSTYLRFFHINYFNERKNISNYVMNLTRHWRKVGNVKFLF